MEKKLRVLVVDDSAVYRKILSNAVDGTEVAITVETASNGIMALERLKDTKLDVVLLDVIMPEMDGLETLAAIKRLTPDIVVIMVSGKGTENIANTLTALQAGALDFIVKPDTTTPEANIDFLQKRLKPILFSCQLNKIESNVSQSFQAQFKPLEERQPPKLALNKTALTIKTLHPFKEPVDLIVIASSTGGPAALDQILTRLPGDLKPPVLVVQHMPEGYTKTLAQSLNKKSQIPIVETTNDQLLASGVYFAPGGEHLTLQRNSEGRLKISVESTPPVNGVRPAADVLFKSIAEVCKQSNILAVILTGMGCDGRQGIHLLKEACNCYCLIQSERTCIVYGMPQCIEEAGLADETVDLHEIAYRIHQIVSH